MGAVNDPAVIRRIDVCLSTEFKAEVFDQICDELAEVSLQRYTLDLQAGGRSKELATLLRFTTTVLIPLPFPSILDWSLSIL